MAFEYYLCKLSDVYKAALPSGLKLESETAVSCIKDFEAQFPLRPAEQAVLDAFSDGQKLTVSELEKKTGLRNVVSTLSVLLTYGAVEVQEELKKDLHPNWRPMFLFFFFSDEYRGHDALQKAFDLLKGHINKNFYLLLTWI